MTIIKDVILTARARKDLRTLPVHVLDKFEAWIAMVEMLGLAEVRKIPSFHDEPLKGARKGQRSIRLNRAYRVRGPMAKARKCEAVKYIESLRGGPLTFGALLRSIRECDEYTLENLAERFGVSRSHLCDIEKGRRRVSAERAARWADILGYPPPLFVRLALQDEIDAAGLKLKVEIKAA